MKEEDILNYVINPQNNPKEIYNLLLNINYIPSFELCKIIIENKLHSYVNLICEYHLGAKIQNELYDMRNNNINKKKIIDLIIKSKSTKIPKKLEENIKKSILIFGSRNIDEEQLIILNLYLESIKIDNEYKAKLQYLISVTNNIEIKKLFETHIGIDPLLDNIINNIIAKLI